MDYKAFIFDLDGTLLNTLPTIEYYCNKSLAHFGFGSITTEQCRDLCRLSVRHFYHKLLELGGCPAEDIEQYQPQIRDYDIQSYLSNATHLTCPFKGVPEVLADLKQREIILGVLTNKPQHIADKLVRHFFGDMFTYILGQTLETIPKPDPGGLRQITGDCTLLMTQILYIGDTDIDMETSINAKADAAAVSWGYQTEEVLAAYKPKYLIHKPEQLLEV